MVPRCLYPCLRVEIFSQDALLAHSWFIILSSASFNFCKLCCVIISEWHLLNYWLELIALDLLKINLDSLLRYWKRNVFNVALFKSACTANSLISATDEAYVKGLSEEGFNSLKSHLNAYSSLAKLDLEFALYAKDANRIKGTIALSEDIATISQRMDQFREQADNVRSAVTTLGIFKIPDEPVL